VTDVKSQVQAVIEKFGVTDMAVELLARIFEAASAEKRRARDRDRKRLSRNEIELSAESAESAESAPSGTVEREISDLDLSSPGRKTDLISLSESPFVRGQVDQFKAFWEVYPRKQKKDEAWDAWKKRRPPFEAVMLALSWQIQSHDWVKQNRQFVPTPPAYINQGRWKDEKPATEPVVSDKEVRTATAIDGWLARRGHAGK
jgi:hypothetical protein